jgi:hypothetical protein
VPVIAAADVKAEPAQRQAVALGGSKAKDAYVQLDLPKGEEESAKSRVKNGRCQP